MKKALPAILAMAAALFARPASAETVQIANAADWAAFANRVNSGETTLDAEMTANVMLTQDSPRVGTDGNPYGGAFDGLGHRLTLWISRPRLHTSPAPQFPISTRAGASPRTGISHPGWSAT